MSDTVPIQGKDGEAFYYTLDRVLTGLLGALAQGRIDEAADLYMRCRADIGFQLISRAQGNAELFKQVANLFFQARDFQRAAYCCEQMEEHAMAAQLYERADDHAAAALMYAAASNWLKAAEMYEKSDNLVEAAKLYRMAGEHLRAAMCLERTERFFDAAQAYEAAGRGEKALELYQAVDDDSPDRKAAQKAAKDIAERMNLRRAATGQMAIAQVPGAVPIAVGGGDAQPGEARMVTMMEGFHALQRLPLFEELSLDELRAIYHLCELQPFPFGARLIEAGKPAPALFIVVDGVLDVRHGGAAAAVPIARLQAGAHVGEMSLLDDAPSSVDVVAAAPGRALRLSHKGLRDALQANDALAARIYRVMARTLSVRLRDTTAKIGRA